MAIPIFSILLIVLTVLLFVKDFFYKPLIIAKREGAKYKVLWKESFELFFKHYFVFYLIVAVSTNLGYFIQVPNLLKLNDFVMLVVLTILCIIKIFQGRFNKKILFIGLLLIGSILIGLVLFAIFPYTKPLIYDIDEFVSGQEYRQYIPTIGMGIKEAIFLVVKYVLVLSVCSYEFKTKKDWMYVVDAFLKVSYVVIFYGLLEILLKKAFEINLTKYFLNPIFGETVSTFDNVNRMQGFYKEASHYAMFLFCFGFINVVKMIAIKKKYVKGKLWFESIRLLLIVALMLASTSFAAMALAPILILVYLWYVIDFKRKWIMLVCLPVLLGVAILLGSNQRFMTAIHLESVYDRINKTLLSISTIFTGKVTTNSSSCARFLSMHQVLKVFVARPVFGVAISSVDGHTTIFSGLANLGIVGFALWVWIALSFSRSGKHNLFFVICQYLSMIILGGIGYVLMIIYPVLLAMFSSILNDSEYDQIKNYNKVVINGTSLAGGSTITGIQRVCREIILRLDEYAKEHPELKFEYYSLKGAPNRIIPKEDLKHIKFVESKAKRAKLASVINLPLYAEKEKALILSLDPNMLMSCDNIASVYDLRPLLYKNYDAKRFRFMYRLSLTAIKVFSRRITTDSDYQRADISKYLKYPIDRIDTIYCGWEHLKDVVADEGIFKKHPELKKGEYYYSLGSLAPHKNFKWVMEIAKKNPDKIFAIAGGKDLRNWKDDIETTEFNNITFVGYVSDEESKALMQNCKAFLHPSIYEGFGIPPLEALSCGAKIIISNATCLPEVYEDSAHYFDPYDYEVDLDKLLDEEVADPNKILEKCSWDKATKQISALIEKEIYEVR